MPPRSAATAQGLVALALWASTVALSRSLAESVGTLTAAAAALGGGGLLSLGAASLRGRGLGSMLRLGRRYLLGCGGLFVGYMACLYAAIGLAPDRPTALLVGLLNYLWPPLMVALSVPLLRQPARMGLLALGCLLALVGTAVALVGGGAEAALPPRPGLPLALAAAAGVLWALYSNLVRRWGPADGDAVPLFLLASAVALVPLLLGSPEASVWSGRAALELGALAVGPLALAYSFWERGVRRGDHALLGLASYFVPVASLLLAAGYLGVAPGPELGVGCGLVVAGALVGRAALLRPAPSAEPG